MRCKAVRTSLDRYIRQELAPRMQEPIEAHLSQCADCRRHLSRQEALAALLRSIPEPPAVPEGFAERLMAAVRQRQAEHTSMPASRWRVRWSAARKAVGHRAAQLAVLAGGLLIGMLMGQQTWCSVHRSSTPQASQADPVAAHELDYLTDAPGNSLAESYLRLTRVPDKNGA